VAAILLGTGFLWKGEVNSERANLQKATSTTAAHVADHVESELYATIHSLERMADRIKSGMESNRALWARDAHNHIAQRPGIQAIEWIDKDLQIRWVEPVKGNEKVLGLNIRFDDRRKSAVERACIDGETSLSMSIDLVQGGKGFLVYSPVFRNGKFDGMVAGVYRLQYLISSLDKDACNDRVEVIEDNSSILSNGKSVPTGAPFAIVDFNCLNSKWALKVTAATQNSRFGSPLALMILIVGISLSVITTFAFVSLDRWMTLASTERNSRKFLEGMTESSGTSIYVFDFSTRRMSYSNRFGYESLGITEKELLDGGLPLLKKLVHPEDWPKTMVQFAEVRKLKDGEVYNFEHRIQAPDGSWRWIVYRECVLERTSSGAVLKVLLTSLDITERKAAESIVAQAKEDLENVLMHAPIGMAIVGLDGRWIEVNPALCEIIGYTKEELLPIDFQTITHPDDLESDLAMVRQVLSGEVKSYSMEKRYYHKTGRLVWVLLCVSLVRQLDGKPRHFISQIQDISDRKLGELLNMEFTESLVQHSDFLSEANSRLEIESRTDSLTGLANRRYFGEQFAQTLNIAQRYDQPLCAIMLDVDHFKGFNDEFGHSAGDVVLQHVAVVLREICRDVDLPARWGGEEFIVLCPETDLPSAAILAERLRKKISEITLPYRSITASFGVAMVGQDPTTFFDRTDNALYEAKSAGRNCVAIDDQSNNFNRRSA